MNSPYIIAPFQTKYVDLPIKTEYKRCGLIQTQFQNVGNLFVENLATKKHQSHYGLRLASQFHFSAKLLKQKANMEK